MILPFGYSLEAEFPGGLLLFFTLTGIMLLYVFWTNWRRRSTKRQMSKGQMGLIFFLRFAAVLLLIILVLDPQLTLKRTRSIPQRIAVVIDQSRSMLSAWQGSGMDLQVSIISIINDLKDSYEIDVWSMDGDILELESLEFIKDISVFSWIPSLRKSKDEKNIYSAVFTISDGHLNGGQSPLDLPWSKSLPIYPIFPLEPRSNAVLKILDITYKHDDMSIDMVQVQLKILQEGLIGKKATLLIQSESGQTLGEQVLRLNHKFTDFSIPIRLPRVGSNRLNAIIALDNGDLEAQKQFDVERKKSIKNVLLVSERLNELHKFLLLNLPDSLYQVYTVLGTNSKQNNSHLSFSANDLDLIILNQPGSQVFRENIVDLVRSGKDVSCPIILFHDGSEWMETGWSELMGIQQQKNNNSAGEFTVYWSDAAKNHPLYLGLLGRGFSPSQMIKYPPVQRGKIELGYAGSDLLVTGVGRGQVPAMILGDTPPVAIFSGGAFWKWFFHPQANTSFHKLWQYLFIYLEDIADFKPVTLEVPFQTATTGTYISVDVFVKDLDNRAISSAELRAWQEDGKGHQEKLDLSWNTVGKYTATLKSKYAGENLIIAEAYRFGELWGSDTSRIQLVAFNGEDQSMGVDENFLARLARRSGGAIIHSDKEELPIIPEKYFERRSSTQLKGVRSSRLFVILLTLLILEWILRRRNGLL